MYPDHPQIGRAERSAAPPHWNRLIDRLPCCEDNDADCDSEYDAIQLFVARGWRNPFEIRRKQLVDPHLADLDGPAVSESERSISRGSKREWARLLRDGDPRLSTRPRNSSLLCCAAADQAVGPPRGWSMSRLKASASAWLGVFPDALSYSTSQLAELRVQGWNLQASVCRA